MIIWKLNACHCCINLIWARATCAVLRKHNWACLIHRSKQAGTSTVKIVVFRQNIGLMTIPCTQAQGKSFSNIFPSADLHSKNKYRYPRWVSLAVLRKGKILFQHWFQMLYLKILQYLCPRCFGKRIKPQLSVPHANLYFPFFGVGTTAVSVDAYFVMTAHLIPLQDTDAVKIVIAKRYIVPLLGSISPKFLRLQTYSPQRVNMKN